MFNRDNLETFSASVDEFGESIIIYGYDLYRVEDADKVMDAMESRIKELESDTTIRERDIQRIEKMNIELVAENNILKAHVKELEELIKEIEQEHNIL